MSGRPLPVETVHLPADRRAWDAAHAEWQAAAAAVQNAAASGPPPPALLERRAAAEAAVTELAVISWDIVALPADEWETKIGEHPAAEGAVHGWPFEPRTFLPAVLAETATSGGEALSVEQWTALFAGQLGQAERNQLFDAVVAINAQAPVVSPELGKGSARTPS
ncbi:hypothetical protein [Pseudonocardia sp. NPDC049635]|uniref:hypothetical protein n=1 Tax=Pseudonocardia sp. NPDC049635 TaxID=3155506 RepID=UPI0033D633D2